MAAERSLLGRTKFHRYIQARWPDPQLPGWDILQLACGHRSAIHTVSRNLEQAHCADCQLNSATHDQAIAEVMKRVAEVSKKEHAAHAEPDDSL